MAMDIPMLIVIPMAITKAIQMAMAITKDKDKVNSKCFMNY